VSQIEGLMRHLRAGRFVLPGGRVPFRLGDAAVGWVTVEAAGTLVSAGCRPDRDEVVLDDVAALPALVSGLAASGAFGLRGEDFDVRVAPDAPPLATIDRGALPWFGMLAEGVHLNGLVQRQDGLHLWVARRATDKKLDPGKLDHIVAGGIPAGLTPAQTLVKEAAEEAGLGADLVAQAAPQGVIDYTILRQEGLRRDRLHCYDLYLPEKIQPVPQDGEVAGFELWPMDRVLRTVAETDDFKFNVNLVLIELFGRLGLIGPLAKAGAA
jgi:8-oxo-dGTP pyrophosphatase MutT (NUDIX family)